MYLLRNVKLPLWVIALFSAIVAQGLFEAATSGSSGDSLKSATPSFEASGYIKGALYGGRNNNGVESLTGSHAQTALKLNVRKGDLARAFAEVRLDAGYRRDTPVLALDIREAWGSISPGRFDIRLGRQIVAWGRADGINPTNNITPKDQCVLSSEYDDTRLGNELLSAGVKLGPFGLLGIWIPYYRPDVLPLEGAALPAQVTIAAPSYPDHRLENSGCAVRLDGTFSLVDGSISYFNGYATQPGFAYSLGLTGIQIIPTTYRMQVIGADFSTAIASTGLRGEAAFKMPRDDPAEKMYIPQPYLQYIVGLDRSIGSWTALVQYCGSYVPDFDELVGPHLENPSDPMAQLQYMVATAAYEMNHMNRLFSATSREISHSVTGQVQWNTLYETLHFKMAGMYSFTTRDYAVNPDITYDVTDAVAVSAGGRYLDGPEKELNTMVSDLLSFVYAEIKWSF